MKIIYKHELVLHFTYKYALLNQEQTITIFFSSLELSNINFPKVLNSEGKIAIDYLRENKKVFIIQPFPLRTESRDITGFLFRCPLSEM